MTLVSFVPGTTLAQVQPDRALLAEIRAIRAIDNHSHLPPADANGTGPAPVLNSLGETPFRYPVRLRVDNPQWMRAWRALYNSRPESMKPRGGQCRPETEAGADAAAGRPMASVGPGQSRNRHRPGEHACSGNPLLLEPALNEATLRATRFVLIHGGWPFDRQAGVMLIKPNVYADFSAQNFLRSPRALSETLRAWLEWYPEKVLFGTDAYPDPNTPLAGWEEMLWLANDTAREALAMALTGMMNDGQITRARAVELARMVLRENAIKLYALGPR